MATPTPQTLVAQASCYLCAGASLVEGMEMALLADIINTLENQQIPIDAILDDQGRPILDDTGNYIRAT